MLKPASKRKVPNQSQVREEGDPLLAEILALGGTADDFALLQDLDVDTEDEAFEGDTLESSQAATLRQELRKFLKNAHFVSDAAHSSNVDTIEPPPKRRKTEPESLVLSKGLETASKTKADSGLSTSSGKHSWLIEPTATWHALQLSPLPTPAGARVVLKAEQKAKLRKRAETLLEELTRQYTEALSPHAGPHTMPTPLSKSDKVFLSNILSSGTSSDRLSALILVTSSSPLHASTYLGQLLTLCSKKSRDEALRAVQSVSEWLRGSEGGLPDRKLVWFGDRDEELYRVWAAQRNETGRTRVGDEWLAMWLFEDRLKKWYADLLRVIEALLRDPLPFVRIRALSHVAALLSSKPEQEHNLLILAASLLTDSDRSVASKASHLLLELLNEHSLMKAVVIREVAAIALRPTLDVKTTHGRYYGVITLNQIVLKRDEEMVADRLLDVYFRIFEEVLMQDDARWKSKGGKSATSNQHDIEENSKLLAAVLTGVNRALPYATLEGGAAQGRLDTLYRITHQSHLTVSMQALSLIHRLTTASSPIGAPPDRFYRILYGQLIDLRLVHFSKQAMFLNLVFRCMKADPSQARQAAFCKRLLQSSVFHAPPYICGILRLLQEILGLQSELRNLLKSPMAAASEDVPRTKMNGSVPGSDVDKHGESNERLYTSSYDAHKREPLHAGADKTCMWDLLPLLSHYHPTVRLFARELLGSLPSSNKSDIDMHSLSAFLDRFAYRESNLKAPDPSEVRPFSRNKVHANGALLTKPEFARKAAQSVPVDQMFFHQYFKAKQMQTGYAVEAGAAGVSSEERSSLDEDEVWSAMRASARGAPGFDLPDEDPSDALDGEVTSTADFDYTSDEEEKALDALVTDSSPNRARYDAPIDAPEASIDGPSSNSADELVQDDDDVFASEDEVPAVIVEKIKTLRHSRDKKSKIKALPVFADADIWAGILDPDAEI